MNARACVVTGASGFVGRRLACLLGRPRPLALGAEGWAERIAACDFSGATVLHLAARVHAPHDAEELFRRDNVEKTRVLAEAAARGGARRFVLLSSAKVYGDASTRPFTLDDSLAPGDAYARSKVAAEAVVRESAARAGMPFSIVRPPLVYGAGAGGNLRALLRLADTPWPLPFAALEAPRSFVHVDDLARLLAACVQREDVPALLLAAHPQPVTVRFVVERLRDALGRPRRLFAMPPRLLEGAARWLGRGAQAQRLVAPLELDAAPTRAAMEWTPGVGPEAAVRDLVTPRSAR